MKLPYNICKAKREDLGRILEIYGYARRFMAANGNPNQWGSTNPPREILEQDIAQGNLYTVEENGKICGVFFFKVGDDPTYRQIFGGEWISNAPYGTVHRIASNGSGGIFAACLAFCKEQCMHLRIDTHRDNRIMQHLVEKAGFSRRGIICLPDGAPRIVYEWI